MSHRRKRIDWFKFSIWAVAALLIIILIVIPLSSTLLINLGWMPTSANSFLNAIETSQKIVMRFFTAAWIFTVGSCIASFLNVVAWRIPRGRSILGSSRCPYCNIELTFRDNMPVVGWLRNRGRCSTCRLPISARYLIAEVALGSIFLLLAFVELAGGGWNLPFGEPTGFVEFERVLMDPNWTHVRIYCFQLVLVSAIFTFTLIRTDNLRIPFPLVAFFAAAGILSALAAPDVILVALNCGPFPTEKIYFESVLTVLIGLAVGFAAGIIVERAIQKDAPSASRYAIMYGLVLVGLFLGWQSTLVAALLMTLLWRIQSFLPMGQARLSSFLNPQFCLMIAVLIHVLSWRAQTMIPFGLGNTPVWLFPTILAVLNVILLATFSIPRTEHPEGNLAK